MAKQQKGPDAAKKTDYGISRELFVTVWETSESPQEVFERLAAWADKNNRPAMPKAVVLARAADHRAEGMNLKKFKAGRKARPGEVEKLNALIADIRAKQQAGVPVALPEGAPLAAPPARDEQKVLDTVAGLIGKK